MQQLVPERLIPGYLGYRFTADIAGQIWLHDLVPFASVPFYCKYSFTCLNRVTLLVYGIYNEKKGGNLQLIHRAQSSKGGVWQHHGCILPRHPYMLHTKKTIPLLLYNSPPSDFVTSKLVQKVLQQFHNFYSLSTGLWQFGAQIYINAWLYLQTIILLPVSRTWSASFENFNLNIDKWAELNTGNICEHSILNGYFCFSWHFTTLSGVLFHVQCQGWESASDD